jgi:hypothetical protein
MRRALATALMATGVLFLSARPCWACSCVAQPPKAQADNADVIFTGRVIEAEDPFRFSGPRVQAVLAVEVLYKGEAGSEILVETYPGGSASCGLEFVEGERFTVFAFLNERGRLETNICSASTTGSIDPARFGLPSGGAAPGGVRGSPGGPSGTAVPQPDPAAFWLPVGALAGAVAVIGLGVGLAIRSRRSATGT